MNSREKLSTWFAQNENLDAFLITNPTNIRWLTGFAGSFAMVLLTREKWYFLTDPRYAGRVQELVERCDLKYISFTENFAEEFGKNIFGNLGVEDSVSLARFERLKEFFPAAKLMPQKNVVEELRRQKSADEREKTQKAQTHVDAVLLPFLRENVREGMSEKKLAYKLRLALEDGGRYELSFPSIVAFAENSAIPHHDPGERALKSGDNILIDCGVRYEGYCSDMTRNFVFGAADPEYRAAYESVLSVQSSATKQCCAGMACKDLDALVREALGKNAECFIHSLGHGVGLEIHEAPSLSAKSESVLLENEIVTIEPGIYFLGKFGIRVEDLVWVGKNEGKVMSKTPKELICL